LNLTRNEADTHDLLQEVFVRLARRPGMLAGVSNVRQYLLRLAHNLAVDLVRRRSTRERRQDQYVAEGVGLFAAGGDPDGDAYAGALSSAMGELPVEQRRWCI
jgi:DNA-directed RNA polymerase specialized sigma24 family protein